MSQSNSIEKKIYGELLCLTATVDEWNFIFHTAFHACHACCSSDAKKAKATGIQANAFFAHTNKKCLHGLWPPLYFAGGIRRRPCPVVRACLVHAWLPRTSHTPAVGTLGTHSDLRCRKFIGT